MRAGIEALAARLTRFDPGSELCALNADPRRVVPASPLLRRAVAAALLGARRTGGLADPTLLDAVEAAGYAPLADRRRARLARGRPPRRAAAPPGDARRGAGARSRSTRRHDRAPARACGSTSAAAPRAWPPTGPRRRLARAATSVDCGGDVRVGGTHDVALRGTAHTLRVTDGAVATSGIDRRVWRRPDGSYAHHLLDPAAASRPGPAWSPPPRSPPPRWRPRRWRRRRCCPARAARGGARRAGGVLVHDDGRSERVGRGRAEAGGMTRDPMDYGWWLASRASGLVALALITLSVGVGLAMAGRAFQKPGPRARS